MTETSDLSLLGALLQSVNVLPFSKHTCTPSRESLIPLWVASQNLRLLEEGGWVVGGGGGGGGSERKMGGGREERKAKSVGGGEEALSYLRGSVSQCSYILGG